MIGRPSKFNEKIVNTICNRISDGESLRAICIDENMPGRRTVLDWLRDNDDFSHQYAHACDHRADLYADEIIEIADTEKDAQIARVRIDARKWVASKLKPKKYGTKLDLNHSGPISVKETSGAEKLKQYLDALAERSRTNG